MRKIDPVLYERLATLIGSMGYELLGCEMLTQGGQLLFRLYIDSAKGVVLEDCSLVSRQVSAMMDVEDPIQGQYTLEVSSPGIDRPLFEIEHYRRYIGKRVKVRLYTAINQRRQFKGLLQRVDEDAIYIVVDDADQAIKLPFSAIEKGNLIGEIDFS
jgi:ribosome maturation factor RimP